MKRRKCAIAVVTLKTPEGKQIMMPLSRLSPEDREYVRKKLKEAPAPAKKSSARRRMRSSPGSPQVVARMKPGETFTRKADGKTGITYHVYVPTSFESAAPPPLIIAFSPTGNGMQMVKALKASAEKVGWLVAGCDKLRNGMDSNVKHKMQNEVLDDIMKSIPHQIDRRCLAGFSGGAMSCYGLSVKGRRPEHYFAILAFGGWLGGRSFQGRNYSPNVVIAQINGDKDKGANAWIKRDAASLTKKGCVVREFKFPGGHAIAPSRVIDGAIAWLLEERAKLEQQARRGRRTR
jgi:predicted esterase